MSKIVLCLSIVLGAFFTFFGVIKITTKLSKDLHMDVREQYVKYTKVMPLPKTLIQKMFYNGNVKARIQSKHVRRTVGGMEIALGLILMLIPIRRSKNAANTALILLQLFILYCQWRVDDDFERVAPTLVFLLMLICRLVVDWQVYQRSLQPIEETDESLFNDSMEDNKNDDTATTPSLRSRKKKEVNEDDVGERSSSIGTDISGNEVSMEPKLRKRNLRSDQKS